MLKPKIGPVIHAIVVWPLLVIGTVCHYTGKGLTVVGTFILNVSGVAGTPTVDK